ncbi:MAG TPA: hypothetical protein DCZ38_01520, partial [Coxiellaceae bacterium]|nr:hypothetical protein [Coxiellaceae bacterium]
MFLNFKKSALIQKSYSLVALSFFVLFSLSVSPAIFAMMKSGATSSSSSSSLADEYKELHSEIRCENEKNPMDYCVLKPFQEEHEKAYCDLFNYPPTESVYMRYYTDGKPVDREKAKTTFAFRLNRMKQPKPEGLHYMIYDSNGKVAGQISIGAFPSKNPEVAYIVFKDFCRRGFATNSLKKVVELVKKYYPEVVSIKADSHPDN